MRTRSMTIARSCSRRFRARESSRFASSIASAPCCSISFPAALYTHASGTMPPSMACRMLAGQGGAARIRHTDRKNNPHSKIARNPPLTISLARRGKLSRGATMGGVEGVTEVRSWRMAVHRAPEYDDRAELYRQSAERLRQLAARVRFDFGRQQQLLALAEAFDRLAERVERLA